ncbi:hypothetical protein PENTCL1PPCAC_30707, partial [Pristionchus entomophagus]
LVDRVLILYRLSSCSSIKDRLRYLATLPLVTKETENCIECDCTVELRHRAAPRPEEEREMQSDAPSLFSHMG